MTASPVVMVTCAGAAKGSSAAAAALACAASEPDRAALLIDLSEGAAPRSTLVATVGAKALEERLVAHLPDSKIVSRGRVCWLGLPSDPQGFDALAAALPLVRESAAVVHLPPSLLRPALADPRLRPTAVLLRADLACDRALIALAIRDLMSRGLRVGVLKRPLGWLAAYAAQRGALPAGMRAVSVPLGSRLLCTEDKTFRQCYDGKDEPGNEREETQADWGGP